MFAYLFCRAYPVFFPVSFFYIISISFLFRIKFHHFSVPDRTITRCLGKFSFVFPSVSPVAVACFCTKLFGICTKQNIFCTKDGGNSCMFFQHFRDFLCGLRIFLLFSLDFFGERVRFSRLPIRFLRVFFYLVGYDSLVSFPSVCLFFRILSIKIHFFRMDHLSGYTFFLFLSGSFHIFSDAPADFSVLPRILFCIFPSVCKKICCFFIRIIRSFETFFISSE